MKGSQKFKRGTEGVLSGMVGVECRVGWEKKADGQARRQQEQGMVILRSRGMEARQAEGETGRKRSVGVVSKELINKQQSHRKVRLEDD